jgi:aldehyde dehydrogenase (NAD+)
MSVAEIFETMEYGPAPESDAPARDWLAGHGRHFGLFVNGAWLEASGTERIESIDPASGAVLATVAQGDAHDVDTAVAAARSAFESWSKTSGHLRARHLYALARMVQRNSRLFAVLESLDNGKPIRESRDIDIPLVARHLYHHAGWAQLQEHEFPGYTPLGVVGQIIPWNFPLLMLAWKIAPALATGNTVVLKPAEFTPLTALLFAELAARAGLPPGVLNVITGDGRTGELLVSHADVAKIAFTGSTEVGRAIRRATAGSGKHLSLELGGKSPFVVFEDADLDSVVEGIVDAIWFNQGQVCCAGSRLLVAEAIEETLLAKLRERMERLRVGNSLDKAVDIGAIVAPVQLRRIQDLVERGIQEGASIWQPSWACPTEGLFYPPTLFSNVAPAATIAQVEIFGPVLVCMTFRTPEEAVMLANNTPYGLAASVWTQDVDRGFEVASRLQAGTVWINSTNLFDAASGFGGYRESGYGREGGREGLYEYLEKKHAVEASKGASTRMRGEQGAATIDGAISIDRTPKLYIGGKQARPDSGYSRPVVDHEGHVIGEVGEGNRKDIRNAVEAARKAASWGRTTGHARAQVLYYVAENLAARTSDFVDRLAESGIGNETAQREVECSIERLFTYAAWCDKYDGAVHGTPLRGLTIAVHEPIGVVGIACPDSLPLLALISLMAPCIAMGNVVVLVPSETGPLTAIDLYQVLDTSDVPGGVVNIVTGGRDTLSLVLAEHDDVDALWYWGSQEGAADVERASTGNMKRTWTHRDDPAWLGGPDGAGEEFLRQATQSKNIWCPYGV